MCSSTEQLGVGHAVWISGQQVTVRLPGMFELGEKLRDN